MLNCRHIGISLYTEPAARLNQLLLPNRTQAICVAYPFRLFISGCNSEDGLAKRLRTAGKTNDLDGVIQLGLRQC